MSHCATITALSLLVIAALTKGLDVEPSAFKNPHFADGRGVIVHLFEWKWDDIADECERILGPKGYGGVQTSPVTENLIMPTRSWQERYHQMSYRWVTRSGNESQFKDMVRRCNNVGVRIYPDLILNHMTTNESKALGTGGSTADPESRYYPAVPYSTEHFHPHCLVEDWLDAQQIRNCYYSAHDLDQSNEHVIRKIVDLMNDLIAAGIAGFRIESATIMWPKDLNEIYARVQPLNTDHGFSNGSRPFIYQSVWDIGIVVISKFEYTSFAAVEEFLYPVHLCEALRGVAPLNWSMDLMNTRDSLASDDAVVFIETYQLQRITPTTSIAYESDRFLKLATAFMLAHPYGTPVIMSSYDFDDEYQGPPADENENIISPILTNDDGCDDDWICEHRWPQIANMVEFRKTVSGTTINDWWLRDDRTQLAFSRGDQGFIAINAGAFDLREVIRTNLPEGFYCDVISGNLVNGRCSGRIIEVNTRQEANIVINSADYDGVIAIHRNAKLPGNRRRHFKFGLTPSAA